VEKQWIVVEKKWVIGIIVALLVVAGGVTAVVLLLLEEQQVAPLREVIDPVVRPVEPDPALPEVTAPQPDVAKDVAPPQEVVAGVRIVDVAIADCRELDFPRVLAIAEDGTLWIWGERDKIVPMQVGTDTDWKQIVGDRRHYAAIKTDGTLWTWGGAGANLGRARGAGAHIPGQVGIDTDWKKLSSCGALAIRTDGTLWEWGEDWIQQLGTDTDWKEVAGRDRAKVGIRTDGTLWSWRSGQGWMGRAIHTDPTEITQIGTDTNWEKLTCDAWAIRKDGSLWVLAADPIQLGTDTWKYVSAGAGHILAVRTDGTLWAWGRNHWGQLGLGHGDDHASPVQVGRDTNWKRVFAGGAFSLAMRTDGTLWAWGHNHLGQLGLGDVRARLYPVQVHVGPQN